jgi:hypothetical protein
LTVGPAEFDGKTAALDMSGFGETGAKSSNIGSECVSRRAAEKPDHGYPTLLSAHCERPNGRNTE